MRLRDGQLSATRPLISGFTVVRNAVAMGYPILQAIRSILPIVDEYIVAVGAGDDNTRALIETIDDPKIRIVDTIWDKSRNQGGQMLAEKTNEALGMCAGVWCFYLQADEVVHEEELSAIRATCERLRDDARVEGLLFRYTHFYGSFDVVAYARHWYRNEVRIVRNGIGARSVGDAQGFKVADHKPRVLRSGGTVYHYGWVKPPEQMGKKMTRFHYWYYGEAEEPTGDDTVYRFRQIFGLRKFTGAHPAVMRDIVAAQDWQFTPQFRPSDWVAKDWKNLLSHCAEVLTRHRWAETKGYTLLR